MTVDTVDLS